MFRSSLSLAATPGHSIIKLQMCIIHGYIGADSQTAGVEVGSRLATNSASSLLVVCLDTTARIGPCHRAWRNGCSTRELECLREASQFSVDEVTGCALYDRFVVMATR